MEMYGSQKWDLIRGNRHKLIAPGGNQRVDDSARRKYPAELVVATAAGRIGRVRRDTRREEGSYGRRTGMMPRGDYALCQLR